MNRSDRQSEPSSLIKYESPLEITHKLESYRQAFQHPPSDRPSSQEVLNTMLPPRQWQAKDRHFLQYVSHSAPEREDVELVQKKLEQSLLQEQAQANGLCPIRERLISQLFDELIRQVTLNCPERGLMLLRVRDQRKMTIAAQRTVCEEAVTYGLRKQAQAEEGVTQQQALALGLEGKMTELCRRREQLISKRESMMVKYRERKAIESERREYELKAMRGQNQHLQAFLAIRRRQRQAEVEPEKPQEDEG